jgi:putative membrane protein
MIRHSQFFLQALIVISLFFGVASCNNSISNVKDTKEVAEDHNDAKFDNKDQEKDAQFLVNAAEITLEEIKLGQLAQQKGTMQQVKDLGKMMEEAHTKALSDLSDLAMRKSITIPTSPTEDAMESHKKLSDESSADFDKDYCDKIVKAHKDAIDKFEKASEKAEDSDIRGWATSMLPTLREHLDYAITTQKLWDKK